MFTEENRPKCIKCTQPAMCYMNNLWVCGQCLHEYTQKQIKANQKMFLEG